MISSAGLVLVKGEVGLVDETIWSKQSDTEMALMSATEAVMVWYLTYRNIMIARGNVAVVEKDGTSQEIQGDGGQGPLVQSEKELTAGEMTIVDVGRLSVPRVLLIEPSTGEGHRLYSPHLPDSLNST